MERVIMAGGMVMQWLEKRLWPAKRLVTALLFRRRLFR
jgi:hypothetical protein